MNADALEGKIQTAQQRLAALLHRAEELPPPQEKFLATLLEELFVSLEELQESIEELHSKQEELTGTHLALEPQQWSYRELFYFAQDGYLLTDAQGIIQQVNRSASNLLNLHQGFLLGKPLSIFLTPETRLIFHNLLPQVHHRRQIRDIEMCLQPAQGIPFYCAFAVDTIRNYQNQVVSLRWLLRDISKRKQAEAALKQCQMHYRSLVETQGELVCRFQSIGTLTFVNAAFANYFGKQPQELIGQNWISMALETDQEALLKHLAFLSRENSEGTIEHRVKLSSGEVGWQRWYHRALFNGEGEFIEFQSTGRDITNADKTFCEFHQHQTEEKLPPTQNQLPDVLDALPAAVAWISADLRFLGVNRYLANSWGLPPETFVGKKVGSFDNLVDFARFVQQFFNNPVEDASQEIEIEVDGTLRHYLFVSYQYPSQGEAIFIGTNITEYKQTQQQLQAALRGKEISLQEIHHRVKNNFQTIYSILQLQSSNIKDQQLIEIFRDIQSRLKTMGLLHQKMYHSQDLTEIDLAEYIQDLANYLFLAYCQQSNKVVLKLQVNRVLTGINTAIICGQIITELVSNSLKYAFPEKNKSEIFINLTHDNYGKLVLMVGDNGVGLPEEIDFNNLQSLGLRLVNSLVKEIQGNSEVDRDNGTTFKISFTENNRLK